MTSRGMLNCSSSCKTVLHYPTQKSALITVERATYGGLGPPGIAPGWGPTPIRPHLGSLGPTQQGPHSHQERT
jgi:hypothetical protein